MKAIILAAGKGNRLKPYTDNIPKPLLPIKKDGDFTTFLLTNILIDLPSYIDEVIVIVKYFEEIIREYVIEHEVFIKNKNPRIKKITCLTQTGEKGTLGALHTVKDMIQSDEKFLVLNGDDLHNVDELEVFDSHPRAFGVRKKIMPGYKSVQVMDGIVVGLDKQNEKELQDGCLIATGTYMLDGKIFDFDPVVLIDGEIGLPQTLMAHVDSYPSHVVYEEGWVSVNTVGDLEGLWVEGGEK
jgi:NDP-sugar pyrophosphorylase family protein